MHPTSLPGPGPVGTLGKTAFEFVDWLSAEGLAVWQVLPLCPPGRGHSPYSTHTAFFGNPFLIDLDTLVEMELLRPEEVLQRRSSHADFGLAEREHHPLVERAAARLSDTGHPLHEAWRLSCGARAGTWNAACFLALKKMLGGAPWWDWPTDIRDRDEATLSKLMVELRGDVTLNTQISFLFDTQWSRLHAHARGCGVALWGDMPIYVDHDSADVWRHREVFQLDDAGHATAVAGVPPDAFSDTGQLWGHPVYDWDAMAQGGYKWWIQRLERALEQCDRVRLDHFRGLSAYYAVPSGSRDARSGRWFEGPGRDFIDAMKARFSPLPLMAEDLGLIDEEVEALRRHADVPGMRVLQFAFDGNDGNVHLPEHHPVDCVVYTGTHDNDTTCGWARELSGAERLEATRRLACESAELPNALVRAALESRAATAILPVQDLLLLGSEARMNTPGTPEGNWTWRLSNQDWSQLKEGGCGLDLGAFKRVHKGASIRPCSTESTSADEAS